MSPVSAELQVPDQATQKLLQDSLLPVFGTDLPKEWTGIQAFQVS